MYRSRIQDETIDRLFAAILVLENQEECYRFFEDLCTISELKALAQRFDVALMLDKERTYVDIARQTGASTATISRIKRSLQYGAEGYKLAIDKIKKQDKE